MNPVEKLDLKSFEEPDELQELRGLRLEGIRHGDEPVVAIDVQVIAK